MAGNDGHPDLNQNAVQNLVGKKKAALGILSPETLARSILNEARQMTVNADSLEINSPITLDGLILKVEEKKKDLSAINDKIRTVQNELLHKQNRQVSHEESMRKFKQNVTEDRALFNHSTNKTEILERLEHVIGNKRKSYMNALQFANSLPGRFLDFFTSIAARLGFKRQTYQDIATEKYSELTNAEDYLTLFRLNELIKLEIQRDEKILGNLNSEIQNKKIELEGLQETVIHIKPLEEDVNRVLYSPAETDTESKSSGSGCSSPSVLHIAIPSAPMKPGNERDKYISDDENDHHDENDGALTSVTPRRK